MSDRYDSTPYVTRPWSAPCPVRGCHLRDYEAQIPDRTTREIIEALEERVREAEGKLAKVQALVDEEWAWGDGWDKLNELFPVEDV